MVRKLFCAMFVMTLAVGFVAADDFNATITAVKGGKITYQKMKKGEKDGDPVTIAVDEKATIAKADGFGKKAKVGDKIEGGLKNEMFTKISEKGIPSRLTTEGEGAKAKVTQILVFGAKKKAGN
jgi:hypothetical protein